MKVALLTILVLLLAGMVVGITPPNTGDITGVTAGTWTSGGGTSGTVTINGDSASIMSYMRARFFGLADIDGTSIDTNGSGQLILDTTSASLAEAIADRVGAMLSGNTETFITVTYDDADNTIDFVVGVPDSATAAARATSIDTTNITFTTYVANHSSSVGALVQTDTVAQLNDVGLNLEGGTGGLRILENGTLRFHFEGDSLKGVNHFIKNFLSIRGDTVAAAVRVISPVVQVDTIFGSDTTQPTLFASGADIRDAFIYMNDGDWIGRDSNSTRIELDTNNSGTSDDMWWLPLGFLGIGTFSADNLRGIQMGSVTGVTSDFGLWINQNDSGPSYPCSVNLNGTKKNDGTGGGDVYISWSFKNGDGEDPGYFSMGLDASDASRWKLCKNLHSLSTTQDVMIVDTFKKVIFPDGLYLADDTTTTDNKAASRGFVRQTEYIGLNGGDIYWTPEPMKTVAKFLTHPWIDTTATYSYPSNIIPQSWLFKASDTTSGNDSLFVVLQWQADVACSLFAVNFCGKTSSATAATSSLDSARIYVNGTSTEVINVAFASTALDTIAINFADLQLSAQDMISIVFRFKLGDDATAHCKWANIERRRR